jgi:hypothetical protein
MMDGWTDWLAIISERVALLASNNEWLAVRRLAAANNNNKLCFVLLVMTDTVDNNDSETKPS